MKKLGVVFLVLNLLAIDGYVGYQVYTGFTRTADEGVIANKYFDGSESRVVQEGCGEDCRNYIDAKIAALDMGNDVPISGASVTPTVAPQPTKSKVKITSYLPIPGSGSTLATDWTTLAGTDFYMSKADYLGLAGVYFEANMKLMNGNGTAYLRLYDATNGRAVDGSEIATSSQISTFVTSKAISLWDGYNHYQVQAKSLTADTTVFESGRLKIFTEN